MAPPHSGQMQFKIEDLTSSLRKLRLSNICLLYLALANLRLCIGHRTCSIVSFVH